jgi:hypothetical protein
MKSYTIKEVQNIGSYSKLLSMENHSISDRNKGIELVKQKIDSITIAIPKPRIAVGLAFQTI